MIYFLLFCFASVGMTAIIVDGKLFAPFRDWLIGYSTFLKEKREKYRQKPSFTFVEFFEGIVTCYQCCGFWCGLICGLLLTTTFPQIFVENRPHFSILNTLLMWLCTGAAGSVLADLYVRVIELMFSADQLLKRMNPDFSVHRHHETESPESAKDADEKPVE